MSVIIATKTRTKLKVAALSGRIEAITSVVSAVAGILRTAAMTIARLFTHAAKAIAEANMQRAASAAAIEAGLYLNRYRHSSKNDDDLPTVQPELGDHPSGKPLATHQLRAHASALVNRLYPVAIVFAIFAVIIVATITLRIAIWLPISAHFKPI